MFDWPFILDFWFGELDEDGMPDQAHRKVWFNASRTVDRGIRRRFITLVLMASEQGLEHWRDEPGGALAEIILLDQFSRNIYRQNLLAFRNDALALELAREGVERAREVSLPLIHRAFFYMPFQHAESRRAQQESVRLYEQLAHSAQGRLRDLLEDFYRSARDHHDIIARFGRFPHRNKVMKRVSTAEELAYLEAGAPRFGQ